MVKALPAPAAGVHGFMPALTSFVGRGREVAELADLVARYRLVTLTGPGGVGKTRLAAQVARQVADRFADGVWLVDLTSAQDPALLCAAVMNALGLRQPSGTSLVESLVTGLARRQLLLVLDNCEHLLTAVAELCLGVLSVADDVRVLATSREPIGVSGEARYRLGPLGLPAPGDLAGSARCEAVTLFTERARRADAHFSLSGESEPLVARLVARLDGMPLAIELAAARVEALGLSGLLDRLADRFRLLVGADRLAAPRQRSLAATVDWSYQLLSEPERRVFRLLSIFPGPFCLEAAEAVAGPAAGPTILHLVDCSLVVPPQPGPDGRPRYLLLETLRAFGVDRLADCGEHTAAAAALGRYALQVGEQTAAGMETSAGELPAARSLDAEEATLHQALTWALGHDPATALLLAVALAPWWRLRGRYAAGYELLRAAAEHDGGGRDAWCAAQIWLGELAAGPTDEMVRLAHFTAARDALAARAPSPMLVRALNGRAGCLRNLGRLSESAEEISRALAMARALGDPAGEAQALYWLAAVTYYTGDHPKALTLLGQAHQMNSAAIPARTMRRCSIGMATLLADTGDYARAREHCGQALASAQRVGDMRDHGGCLARLTDIALRTGCLPEARARLGEAIQLAVRAGYRDLLRDCLDYCGYLCAAARRWAEAITLWSALAASQQASGILDVPQDAQRRWLIVRAAQLALGAARTRAAEERGTAMSLATAVEFAALQVTAEPRGLVPEDPPALSARERELVTLVAQGRSDIQIAKQLFISVHTVRSHLDRIRDKTGYRRRADLTRLALQEGLA